MNGAPRPATGPVNRPAQGRRVGLACLMAALYVLCGLSISAGQLPDVTSQLPALAMSSSVDTGVSHDRVRVQVVPHATSASTAVADADCADLADRTAFANHLGDLTSPGTVGGAAEHAATGSRLMPQGRAPAAHAGIVLRT